MNDAVPLDYASLLREVKQRIRAAQLAALCQVNREGVGLYADIGRLIVSRQEGETWGKRVVANLARDLQSEFPAAAGFSAANLWRMKLFHETYGADEKLAPLVREIGWSHNVVILELSAAHSERELERALTAHVEEFLREMGGKFAFVGSQHRLSVGGRDYFLDLLLYHRRLGALVAIELKVAEFEPEYVGKMQFYLAALDDAVRLEGEAPAMGSSFANPKTEPSSNMLCAARPVRSAWPPTKSHPVHHLAWRPNCRDPIKWRSCSIKNECGAQVRLPIISDSPRWPT